ncbi:hypothetical protein VW35_03990 [Devosia soli]|uniref:HNH nuclease domain-containing protein n=1 Tax=Devosia soli TaxID=361041 RepID=A0A0F5LG56_9HYPH|nr:HNH endonuclease signature motif containing protein [Devosia soli]KKB80537.1 hypothetical protein VW35_03990 [Devosia soli]
MTALPVEWVLLAYYGPSAHRATYGRLGGTTYTKDYIQLSRKTDFTNALANLFPPPDEDAGSVSITYRWPQGTAPGAIVFQSADRPHLKWETSQGAPLAWKMTPEPNEGTAETIPGNPNHLDTDAAEGELELLQHSGAGQPYLLAIKLRGQPAALHVRAYLEDPTDRYSWANLDLTPPEIQALAQQTSQSSALAWSNFQSGGTEPSAAVSAALSELSASTNIEATIDSFDIDTGQALTAYLQDPAYGLFFDPDKNHDGWLQPTPLNNSIRGVLDELLEHLRAKFPTTSQSDAVAESLEVSPDDVAAFAKKIENGDYEVLDTYASTKTRGSAQRAFSKKIRENYSNQCAITGISTTEFLVAAHIVPWSQDQKIRLDPSNGICLSLLMDQAFESGYILIEDDLTIAVDWEKVGKDDSLRSQLEACDGGKLSLPKQHPPKPDYLRRRRELN